MTVENTTMGEQPIFTCKAHVFHIDPKTKKSWIPASTSAINVSFFYDSTRNLYRIISVEGVKAVINSTITNNMTFTKTSQKFGQWSDPRANTVYGLGFANESELTKFIEKFQEVKEATKQNVGKVSNDCSVPTAASSNPVSSVGTKFHLSGDGGGPSVEDQAERKAERINQPGAVQSTVDSPKHSPKTQEKSGIASSLEAQLKYENDRLKFALSQSSANAKKWEVELQALKASNNRLTAALQESTANVDEWKIQLHAYKEENAKLKTRVLELEAAKGSSDAASELRHELQLMQTKVDGVEVELQSKEDEIRLLTRQLADVTSKAGDERIKILQENDSLKSAVAKLQAQLDKSAAIQQSYRRLLESLAGDIGLLQRRIATELNT